MKKIISWIIFFLIESFCYAQKNDNVWIFGYYYSGTSPVCGLDFYFGTPDTVGFYPPFDFIGGSDISISDNQGNLQFYSNGDRMGNWNNSGILSSANFNDDSSGSASILNNYYQGIISVPYPDQADWYAVFHLSGIGIPSLADYFPAKLFYSVVNMQLNGGMGKMTVKRNIAFSDTLLPCIMQTVKHGNGRDWWIINHKAFSDKFYLTLLTSNGVVQSLDFNSGPNLTYFNNNKGQSIFSPDGSMFAIAYPTYNSIYLFDFDRCNGSISFRDSVHIIPNDPNELPVWGCSFSPSSRYFYATTNNDLYQFDTWAGNFGASQVLIATFDGFSDPYPDYFFRQAIGPDGKIYIASANGSRYLHVINNPDMSGSLCDFVQHQLKLVSYYGFVLPEFPNYRLGIMQGSSCDSLTSVNNPSQPLYQKLQIAPNPNNGEFTIFYTLTSGTEGKLKIINLLNEKVFEKTLPRWSTQQHVTLPKLTSGLYDVLIENDGNSFSSKFIKKN